MSYVDVFGGAPAAPSEVSLRKITLSADQTLYWPWNNNNSEDILARQMDVTPTTGSLDFTLPPANQSSLGMSALFRNLGADSFNVLDNAGGVVIVVAPGQVWYVYVSDNTTAAGTWRNIQFGAAASGADALGLAGQGLTVITSLLNLNYPVVEVINNYTLDAITDRANHFVTTTSSGAFTLSLPPVSDAGDGYFAMFSNIGTGAVTIDPDGGELIDGQVSLSIAPGESLIFVSSGAQWYSVGRGRSTIFVQTRLVKSVAGSSDVTLTTTEAGNIIQSYTGLLTGNINVIVPTTVAIYFPFNNTTGAFTVTVKTAAGTGVQVTQGARTIVYCDGTNVVVAIDETATTSFFMADGSAPSPGLAFQADTDTGFFRPSANVLAVSAGGVEQVRADANGVDVTGTSLRLEGTDVLALMTVL